MINWIVAHSSIRSTDSVVNDPAGKLVSWNWSVSGHFIPRHGLDWGARQCDTHRSRLRVRHTSAKPHHEAWQAGSSRFSAEVRLGARNVGLVSTFCILGNRRQLHRGTEWLDENRELLRDDRIDCLIYCCRSCRVSRRTYTHRLIEAATVCRHACTQPCQTQPR